MGLENPEQTNLIIEPKLIRVGLDEKYDELEQGPEAYEQLKECDLDKVADAEGRTLAAFVLRRYKKVLQNPESQIGQGNHGIVFSLEGTQSETPGVKGKCVKCHWENLTVKARKEDGTPTKDYTRMPAEPPAHIKKLFDIQRYFDMVKARNRRIDSALGSDVEFAPQNGALLEAQISQKARYLLKKKGIDCGVPLDREVLFMHIEHDRWESGESDKARYYVSEDLSLQVMDEIDGFSLEDTILGYPDKASLPKDFDADKFTSNLTEGLKALHEGGLSHNDVTLRNILCDANGKPWIVDFGASSIMSTDSKDMEGLGVIERRLRAFMTDPKGTKDKLQQEFNNLDKKF